MGLRVSVLFLALVLTGCASTHSLLVYRLSCKADPNFLNKEIKEKDFEFIKAEPYQVCPTFQRYKIIRKNITQVHLDGRSFEMEEVQGIFYAKYDKSRCELTVVTPWDGRVSDFEDTNHILNEYYYAPLVARVSDSTNSKITYSSHQSFDSEKDFKRYCEEKGL